MAFPVDFVFTVTMCTLKELQADPKKVILAISQLIVRYSIQAVVRVKDTPPVRTGRFNGPYVQVVCTGRPFMSPVMLYPIDF